jgi:REase_AHJR-like
MNTSIGNTQLTLKPGEKTQLERQRLLKAAREYRQRGYHVILQPDPAKLPLAMENCHFDLIAQRDHKTLAVAVRTKENLTLNGPDDLQRMTKIVSKFPDWEFELIVTNPRHPRRRGSA